jgi:hypothetical protein
MPLPRKALVSLEATPYYHCVSRCVRRAFLCGEDAASGRSFEHRRAWIEQRLLSLAEAFAIDVCAYAVMHNHYHAVLHVDRQRALGWDEREVVARWHRLFRGTPLSRRLLAGERLRREEQRVLQGDIAEWRARLVDLSWFMRCMNEAIARQANAEDQCKGRFWEGRFTSQALLDEKALVAGLVYVDLNPLRAQLAATPEASAFTSVRQRIDHAVKAAMPNHPQQQPRELLPFVGHPREDGPAGLPFRLTDYLELVDWTGRQLREGKRGVIDAGLPGILQRLAIDPHQWRHLTTHFESRFKYLVGGVYAMRAACRALNRNWVHGISSSRALLEHG